MTVSQSMSCVESDASAPVTIVAFGDSITAANTETGDDQRWPPLLEMALCKQFAPRQVRVVNAGVGGNTSREGLARMDNDVLAHRPNLVLVEFGGNDATNERDRHVHLVEFASNLLTIKAKLDALGTCRMVLVTFPPVVDRNHAWWYESFKPIGGQDSFVEQYRRVTRTFANEHGLPLFDLDAVIRANPAEYILPDGVHLTAAGNHAFASAMTTFLIPLI